MQSHNDFDTGFVKKPHLLEVLAVAPAAPDHAPCVQHQEVDVPDLLLQTGPGSQIADVGLDALHVALEILLREVKGCLVGVGDGDFHARFEAELGDGVADA